MITDFHIQDWAGLRVSTDPPTHAGWLLTSRQGILSTWSSHIVRCIIIKCNEELSFLNVLRETGIGAEFGQFLLFKKLCEFLFVFTQQVSLYFGISLRNRVGSKKVCRFRHWLQIFIRCGLPWTSWVFWLILCTNPLLLRRHWADWRK